MLPNNEAISLARHLREELLRVAAHERLVQAVQGIEADRNKRSPQITMVAGLIGSRLEWWVCRLQGGGQSCSCTQAAGGAQWR